MQMLCLCMAFLSVLKSADATKRPHIIFILADDMGWNDVSFHGSDEIPTPNIDALAYSGVILHQHYVLPACSPSRSALMTGKYATHTGMQGTPISPHEPRGMPLMKILPQYLKDLGYSTYAVGKWHLGAHKVEYAPLSRGFDSFFGPLSAFVGYYDYILHFPKHMYGYDLRRNWTTSWNESGRYATDVFTEETVRHVERHNPSKPMFLYVPHLAVHASNPGNLLEAPRNVIRKFQNISNPARRIYAAMVAKLDESVGKIVKALHKRKMLQDSIVIFANDNGAPTISYLFPNWGSNWPLRGVKQTLWEGAVRGTAIIWSPLLKGAPRISNQLLHITDWLPTLITAAGGDGKSLENKIDGFDQWQAIVDGTPSRRNEILLNIDEKANNSAYRMGKWKLVVGTILNGDFDKYFGSTGSEDYHPAVTLEMIQNSRVGKVLKMNKFSKGDMHRTRTAATVRCGHSHANCYPSTGNDFCLFDLEADPCETNDLSLEYPEIVSKLKKKLGKYWKTLVPQINQPFDLETPDPRHWNNTWTFFVDCFKEDIPGICNKTPRFCQKWRKEQLFNLF